MVGLQMYENLLTRDAQGKVKPALATQYTRMSANAGVHFKIQSGVQFHDGTELTAEDVVYSINRIVDDSVDLKSPQRGIFSGILEAKKGNGEQTVKVRAKRFNPKIVSLFASYGRIMKKEWVNKHTHHYIDKHALGDWPIQTGDSVKSDGTVVVKRFKDDWNGPASAAKLTFKAVSDAQSRVSHLLNDQTDIVTGVHPADVPRLNNSRQAHIDAAASTRIMYAAMRSDRRPFDSLRFRQALNYAIDLETIIQNVLGGLVAKLVSCLRGVRRIQ